MKALGIFLLVALLVCTAVVDVSEARAMAQPAVHLLKRSPTAVKGEKKRSAMPAPQLLPPGWGKKRSAMPAPQLLPPGWGKKK
ncbi:hypothetical protein NPIL_201321 [Nephila pilipes]|uniref:Uncharacterized protein n=1 Tax=Nephila pilipes TaxID=299642 RepID=A0A8X6UMP5_NEPPI|nr:hypothetical protein NPIL_201321 [Nephila pilipes]